MTTATTIQLIPAISSTQSTTANLLTSSTRFEVVEDALKGFNLTHLAEFEKEYPDFDFDHEIKTFKPDLLNLIEANKPTSA